MAAARPGLVWFRQLSAAAAASTRRGQRAGPGLCWSELCGSAGTAPCASVTVPAAPAGPGEGLAGCCLCQGHALCLGQALAGVPVLAVGRCGASAGGTACPAQPLWEP